MEFLAHLRGDWSHIFPSVAHPLFTKVHLFIKVHRRAGQYREVRTRIPT
jgi:hypothetical protein